MTQMPYDFIKYKSKLNDYTTTIVASPSIVNNNEEQQSEKIQNFIRTRVTMI